MTEMLVEKKQNKYYGLSEISYFLDEGERNIDDYYWVFAQCNVERVDHRRRLEKLVEKRANTLLAFHVYLLLASAGAEKIGQYEEILSQASEQIRKLQDVPAEPVKKEAKEAKETKTKEEGKGAAAASSLAGSGVPSYSPAPILKSQP